MIKGIWVFVVIFGLFFLGIQTIRDMTGKEVWSLTKLLTYSLFCAILTLVVLVTIVILF